MSVLCVDVKRSPRGLESLLAIIVITIIIIITIMIYYLILFVEFLILFFTSKFLIQALYGIFFRIFRSHKAAGVCVFIVFCPGVIVHELAHFLTAEILRVPTGGLEIAPKIEGGSLKMGSVQVAATDILRSMLIGVAPIVAGVAVILAVLFFYFRIASFEQFFNGVNLLVALVVVWIIFLITNTMFSSRRDMEGILGFGLAFLFFLLVGAIAMISLRVDVVYFLAGVFNNLQVVRAIQDISLLLLVPVGINTLVFLLARFIVKRI